jgi:hypothetical protein
MRTISVWPDGQDISVNFADQGTHEICWDTLHSPSTDSGISSFSVFSSSESQTPLNNPPGAPCGPKTKGTCTVQLQPKPADSVFVLIGFHLYFVPEDDSNDNHIKEIGIRENNGNLTVTFKDDDGRETFDWNVQYAYVPVKLISQMGDLSPSARNFINEHILPAGPAVLRGFHLQFLNADHHLNQIAIMPDMMGELLVSFRDQNGDDPWTADIEWAICPTCTGGAVRRGPLRPAKPLPAFPGDSGGR